MTVLGLLLFGFALVGAFQDGPQAPPPATEETAFAPRMLAAGESYAESRVLENGNIVVRQWIRTAESFQRLRLTLPDVPGGTTMSATGIEVKAAGGTADGPASITSRGASYAFDETTDVELRYRLTGAVELSSSARGRALALATTLDVRYAPRVDRETRVVRAPEVLSLACSPSPDVTPEPCGQVDGAAQWRVELVGARVLDRVVAQLTLK